MKRLLSLIAIGVALGNVQATTIFTFDDLVLNDPRYDGIQRIPADYGGFHWSEFGYATKEIPDSGYGNAAVSGSQMAFNWMANTASVTSHDPFIFDSAYFTAAWFNDLTIQVDGYLDGVLAYSSTVFADTTGPKFCVFNFIGIDELRFSSFGELQAPDKTGGSGPHFAMDNASFSAIPEPSASGLFALGGALWMWMAFFRSTRRR